MHEPAVVTAASVLASLGRCALVIDDGGELAAALRERLDRTYVTVLEVRSHEAEAAIRACRPWPWMVIGGRHSALEAAVLAALRDTPILMLWLGDSAPAGLPAQATITARFSDLARSAASAATAVVGGIGLAPGGGVDLPGGEHSGNAALEALVAWHPRPLPLPAAQARAVQRLLSLHAPRLRVLLTEAGAVLCESA